MSTKRHVLVCVTAQQSCKQLIEAGRLIADEEDTTLGIISVYPSKQCFHPDIETLTSLNECSLRFGAEMTVYFSDNPIEKIAETVSKKEECILVTGFPGKNGTNFIESIHRRIPNAPICMVDGDGTIYRIDRKVKDGHTSYSVAEKADTIICFNK